MTACILALDQGTTGSRAILFDRDGLPISQAHQEFPQIFPHPGWVEHDPEEIWSSQIAAAGRAIDQAGIGIKEIASIGITNQRETTLLWERATGRPVHNAIVWQCRRSAPQCDRLKASGWEKEIRQRTGLLPDPYFSGTKLQWLLESIPGLRLRAEKGELAFGTVDSWLAWRLSGGRLHITDASNASRTLLFNLHSGDWDETLLEAMRIPRALLPKIVPSSQVYGETDPAVFLGAALPIAGMAGDQQAALFGQGCLAPGSTKNTYGTGAFLLTNTGASPTPSKSGLLTTVAWKIKEMTTYALEGSVFMAGAVVQWLRDGLGILSDAADSEALATSVDDCRGVYFVPAFTGLGAPYWDPHARGMILGLTRGVTKAHLARAALQAIAFQSRDVLEAMVRDTGIPLRELRVDGGAVRNKFLMQFQADILGIPVVRAAIDETTARGAAYLAGLAVGFWRDTGEIAAHDRGTRRFEPAMPASRRDAMYAGWQQAIGQARDYGGKRPPGASPEI
ncbi:MAG: glycerol kinase GlpK [bacterium]|jgi:glycerol kinase